jgi:hypothetical protein
MDRRAKKLDKKRQRRNEKRKDTAIAAQLLRSPALLARAAARDDFGPCFVSEGWDNLAEPELVSVVVTRRFTGGLLVPGVALVDRTCLGVKNGFIEQPRSPRELAELVERVAEAHGGMTPCEPSIAQSIVFHAIDHARSLGFEPHRDFPSALFGPRPAELSTTPWSAVERPWYLPGPDDDASAILQQLTEAVGGGGFDVAAPWIDDSDDKDDVSEDGLELVHSPLERTISHGATSVQLFIYRAPSDAHWHLELEDQLGGSTVWDDAFESDQAALDAALSAIDEEGLESFAAPS